MSESKENHELQESSKNKFWSIIAITIAIPIVLSFSLWCFIEISKDTCFRCHSRRDVILTYSVYSCVASVEGDSLIPLFPNLAIRFNLDNDNPYDAKTGKSISCDGWTWFCSRETSLPDSISTTYCGFVGLPAWQENSNIPEPRQ